MRTAASARTRRAERGLTLIEIMIALMIAAVLFAAVIMSVGALTGSKAKASASELAGVIRSLYDTAALTGKTCRLVFEIPGPKSEDSTKYRAECAAAGITTSRDRDASLRDENTAREDEKRRGGKDERRNYRGSGGSGQPSIQELMEQEQHRVEQAARFSEYTAEEVAPRELPGGVGVSVWTRHQKTAVDVGVAYLYFFPQGYTEKAQVYVRQGDNVWTLSVSPLTGKVTVVSEELEVPRS